MEAGLECDTKVMMSSTKTVSFRKPAASTSSTGTRLPASDYTTASV